MSRPTLRRFVARALVVLGALVAAVAIVAGYVRWQALDDDTFAQTATRLIEDESVRSEVAATLVERLYASVDIEDELGGRLPAGQRELAGPVAAAIRLLADRAAVELLERPRAQALWRASVLAAHDELVALLRDETTVVRVSGVAVVLDLRPLVLGLAERLGLDSDLGQRLPEDVALVRIMDADELERAQDATALFEAVAAWLWVLPLLLWALAIWLARGHRRREVRAIAIGLVVAGVLVLVGRVAGGSYVVDRLAESATVEDAAANGWQIVTALLADGAWAVIAIGLVALLGVWLAGPARGARSARATIAPLLARAILAYGVLAALVFLLVWWAPFAQARRPTYVVVTAALLVLGTEVLRRLVARESPAAAERDPRDALRYLVSHRAARSESALAELERLARLQEQGVLTDAELAREKARLIGASPTTSP